MYMKVLRRVVPPVVADLNPRVPSCVAELIRWKRFTDLMHPYTFTSLGPCRRHNTRDM